jgi:phosphoenolpyruvate synthase/pyruvate phosphate dikinase
MPGVDGLAVAPVVPLDDVPDGAIGIAGYKATRLAELARHGFLVPPSVVVTTALDTFEAEEHSALLAALGPGPFAVRSSGSREDAAGASFAGSTYRSWACIEPSSRRPSGVCEQARRPPGWQRIDRRSPEPMRTGTSRF